MKMTQLRSFARFGTKSPTRAMVARGIIRDFAKLWRYIRYGSGTIRSSSPSEINRTGGRAVIGAIVPIGAPVAA